VGILLPSSCSRASASRLWVCKTGSSRSYPACLLAELVRTLGCAASDAGTLTVKCVDTTNLRPCQIYDPDNNPQQPWQPGPQDIPGMLTQLQQDKVRVRAAAVPSLNTGIALQAPEQHHVTAQRHAVCQGPHSTQAGCLCGMQLMSLLSGPWIYRSLVVRKQFSPGDWSCHCCW
jgi:hypothetical protein